MKIYVQLFVLLRALVFVSFLETKKKSKWKENNKSTNLVMRNQPRKF